MKTLLGNGYMQHNCESIFEKDVTDIWSRLENETRPIVLYGTGNGADKIVDILENIGVKISGIFSSAAFVRERFFRGYRVTDYENCKREFPDMLVLMCFGSTRKEVLDNVAFIRKSNELLAPDVPVVGDNTFDKAFFKKHKNELLRVMEKLADEKSRETFDSAVEFKLTGEIDRLFSCQADNCGIADIDENCVYLDFGAYNGDTVLEFHKYRPNAFIAAVEPDKRNFRKLTENTSHIEKIRLYNALLSDECKMSRVTENRGRGGGESADGKKEIEAVNVDYIVKKEKLPEKGQLVMKFDVEGNEAVAIEGAKNTIQQYCPVMFVSCYHRSEDYFDLPLRVLEINPSYELFMRHHKGIPAWETEFIFVPRKNSHE